MAPKGRQIIGETLHRNWCGRRGGGGVGPYFQSFKFIPLYIINEVNFTPPWVSLQDAALEKSPRCKLVVVLQYFPDEVLVDALEKIVVSVSITALLGAALGWLL
jgi:hypothetical protein